MTNLELSTELDKIYKEGGQLNHTALYIIAQLSNGRPDAAYLEYRVDGDKLPRYTDWGHKFEVLLHNHLGCRTHRIKGCELFFCARTLDD